MVGPRKAGRNFPVKAAFLIANPKSPLMVQIREVLRVKHYILRTEEVYTGSARDALHPLFTDLLRDPLHGDLDDHLASALTSEGSSHRADVAVVATDRQLHIAGVGLAAVCRVVTLPSVTGYEDLEPCVARLDLTGEFVLIEEIAADIPSGDPMRAQEP